MRSKLEVLFRITPVLVLLVAPIMHGQTPTVTFQGPPGARALGMGGAFIGVADDATAAEANPAGLTILTRPEASIHVLGKSLKADNCATCSSDSGVRPTFASYVQPWKRTVVSVYYSSAVETDSQFLLSAGDNFFGETDDTSLQTVGVAGAFRPTPLLSIGASLGLGRLNRNVRTTGLFDVNFEDPTGSVFPGLLEIDDTVEAEDNALAYNAGVLVNPGGRVSLGLVYKKQGAFEERQVLRTRACIQCTVVQLRTLPFELDSDRPDFTPPDYWGAGLALRPLPRTLLAIDYSIQQSKSTFSNEDQEIRAWSAGAEYLLAARNSSLFIPFRVGYSRAKDSSFATSDFFREEASTFTLGTGIVFGRNQIDVAFSRGHTIATDERLRQIIVSGIHRF